MILFFPNLDIFRLALTSGAIPRGVSLSPARAGIDDKGVYVAPSQEIERPVLEELRRLGATVRRGLAKLDRSLVAWPQLLPLERSAREWSQEERTPILFELARAEDLPELVGEILRLGNDRQAFRWIADTGETRALLRVIGPPYYSLLRALDDSVGPHVAAYREQSPRVWVQIGFGHPLAEQIQPPAGQLLLMHSGDGGIARWTFVEEGPFRDIYEILDFALPSAPADWQATELPRRISVPLRLAPSGSTEPAELWVLRENGLEQLDALVQNADDQLLSRLAFAVADTGDEKTFVVRVRPSKLPPPVLVLDGVSFRPYLRLAQLFLPCGRRLHPPLRRDAVARLLAGERIVHGCVNLEQLQAGPHEASQRITWLYPLTDGGFTPQSLPDEAFRPLSQWVDYVLDHDHQALTAWVEAHRFDFESFICADDQPARKPPGPREPKRPGRRPGEEDDADAGEAPKGPRIEAVDKSSRKNKPAVVDDTAFAPAPPSKLEKELRQLEESFIHSKAALDDPDRQALWPRLARLHSRLGHADDAAICWGNALWEKDADPGAWPGLTRSDAPAEANDLQRILASELPKPGEVRDLVLALIGAEPGHDLPLGPAQQFLEKHEGLLGVRLVWLGWNAFHRLSGGDVLALARARDRLLERLYLAGMSADLDLPGFLRFTGKQAGQRFHQVREHLTRLRPVVHKWIKTGNLPSPSTGVYVDLIFAYAFARLGEASHCHAVLREAPRHLPPSGRDEVHAWLIQAFEYRILEALEARTGVHRLPDDMFERFAGMERMPRYMIDRMREHSRILEPHEKIDASERWFDNRKDDLGQELRRLSDLNDRAELARRFKVLLNPVGKGQGVDSRVLATALELAPRLGESFAQDVLARLTAMLEKPVDPLAKALLLEKGMFLAAHYDRRESLQSLVGHFHQLLEANEGTLPVEKLESLLGHTFHSLRKLGLREEVAELLERMTRVIEKHPGADKQRLLLQVASGCFYFGQDDRARRILDDARSVLFKSNLIAFQQAELACSYAETLGQAPVELVLPRLNELFRKLKRVYDTFTTQSHFSLSRLNVVQAAVFALVNDDFATAPETRRWLDEDEFLVRRRIHRDVRAALEKSGL